MPLLSTIGAAAARAFGFLRSLISGYNVANSLRFNTDSSDYLNRTPATTTNQKTYTISFWYKRMFTGTNDPIINVDAAGSAFFSINFDGAGGQANKLGIYWYDGTTDYGYYTDMLFRDFSAWYHIVIAVDTTQATVGDRLKVYVNGVQQTLTAVYGSFTQNLDTYYNSNVIHYIGYNSDAALAQLDGYLSEFYSIDGQALTPSSFGQTDPSVPSSGIWIPKAFSGSYGTNGFYLKFANSAALGTDSSGNGNTWTVNNLTSVDQSTDTPTNNFATWNSLTATVSNVPTFSDGNLTAAIPTSGGFFSSTFAVSKGKWYCETKMNTLNNMIIGIRPINTTADTFSDTSAIGLYSTSGTIYRNGSNIGDIAAIADGDIIGMAIDLDNNNIYFSKNGQYASGISGSWNQAFGTAYALAINSGNEYYVTSQNGSSGTTSNISINFGSPSFTIASGNADANGFGNFEYAVPAGYYSLNTKNLATYG